MSQKAEFGPIKADLEGKLEEFFNHLHLALGDESEDLKKYALLVASRKITQI